MNNRPVIVLGLGPSGLFLVRQLRKITEWIYGLGRRDDIGLYSKYIDKNRRYYIQSEQELLQVFKKIREIHGQKPVLYICSDQYLTMMLASSVYWKDYVVFPGDDLNQYVLINDKNRINAYCAENKINIPASMPYTQFLQSSERQYPIIIKWKEKKLNMASNPVGKVRVCHCEAELKTIDTKLRTAGVDVSELFVQTYIRGNNRWQYSAGGYYNNGKPLAAVVVNQIKQYPQGISAQVVMANDEYTNIIMRIAENFVDGIGFTGFLEMEFKIDEQTNEAYLLDVNPRPWGWISILGTAYPDFFRVLLGETPREPVRKSIWESKLRTCMARRNPQNAALEQDVSGFARAYDIFDREDKLPSIMIYMMAVKKMLKR